MKILIISGGNHPYDETTPILENLLVENGHDAIISESANELNNNNFKFDLIVMNTLRQNDTNILYTPINSSTNYRRHRILDNNHQTQ